MSVEVHELAFYENIVTWMNYKKKIILDYYWITIYSRLQVECYAFETLTRFEANLHHRTRNWRGRFDLDHDGGSGL